MKTVRRLTLAGLLMVLMVLFLGCASAPQPMEREEAPCPGIAAGSLRFEPGDSNRAGDSHSDRKPRASKHAVGTPSPSLRLGGCRGKGVNSPFVRG